MLELRNRMLQTMQLAGLSEGTMRKYVRAVHQLAAYYMISPDQLTEQQVQDYLLYVRDRLEVAKGTFIPIYQGLKCFYVNTLDYQWALFTKKKSACRVGNGFLMFAATPTAAV